MIEVVGGVVGGLVPPEVRPVLAEVISFVVAGCLIGAGVIIRPVRCRALATELRPRLREAAPYLGGLAAILVVNSLLRDWAQQQSFEVGIGIGWVIRAIEGEFVGVLQSSLQTPVLTQYFSYVYIYGYVFLLAFPLVAYLARTDRVSFRRLTTAYSLNYLFGVILYITFFAYGPRNVAMADPLLFSNFPQFQFLTSEVNVATNVFPSLHTAMSTTVAIFAVKTRETYPLWTAVAVGLAASVVVSTMYLGIHWATDVVAGVILAWGCVSLSERYIE